MNSSRYAYRDYEILVSAHPAADRPGWQPEICVISPDAEWQIVPSHHVAADPGRCLEVARRCAENAIQDLHIEEELADYAGPWH